MTIENGTVAFCQYGIYLTGNGDDSTNAVGAKVQNMRATYCYSDRIALFNQPSSLVTGCQVSQIGSSTTSMAVEINASGTGCIIENNQVSNIFGAARADPYCIYADTGSFTKNNKVSTAKYRVASGIYQNNLAWNCTTPFSGGVNGGGNASQIPQ